MGNKLNKRAILSLLAKNEEIVRDIYKEFSKKFPKKNEFWLGLSHDEQKHADSIKELGLKIGKGLEVDVDVFDEDLVTGFNEELISYRNRAVNEKISLKKALSIALDIESSILERKFFKVFQSNEKVIKDTLEYLKNITKKHYKVVKKELKES